MTEKQNNDFDHLCVPSDWTIQDMNADTRKKVMELEKKFNKFNIDIYRNMNEQMKVLTEMYEADEASHKNFARFSIGMILSSAVTFSLAMACYLKIF